MTVNAPTKHRAPMSFGLDVPKAKAATAPPNDDLKKIATRLPSDLYKQAKARAALDGVTIQDIIKSALTDYIAKGDMRVGK